MARRKYGSLFYSPERREKRHEDALRRNRDWKSRTPEEKIRILDNRLGEGLGAKKQRAKLLAQIKDKPSDLGESDGKTS